MTRIVLAFLLLLSASPSRAESWCAAPIFVHEWGVHVFAADGKALPPVELPPWFHRTVDAQDPTMPVRALPVDSGVRLLPVLHFYAPHPMSTRIPIGLEVGFKGSTPAVWFPGVDRVLDGRLMWDRLELTATPRIAPIESMIPWVTAARALPALWVERPGEGERFVFYEAATHEAAPLVVRRGPGWTATHRELVIDNRGPYAVHDLFFVHRDGARAFAFEVETLAAGRSITFVVDDNPLTTALEPRLHKRLSGASDAQKPGTCVTGRDPKVAVTQAHDHRLYDSEADLVLAIWGKRFFDTSGTTILYREPTQQLDDVMPLALYTDMFHFITLNRSGLALWQGLRI